MLPSLDKLKSVHVVGVCGTLMGAFAAHLKSRGVAVTGSDQNVYPPMSDVLERAGVKVFNGYSADNLKSKPDLVIIGNVIRADNPEARAAIDGGMPYSSLPEAMEKLLLPRTRNLVVSGTHGKTTTSSMLAHVLVSAKRDPSYFIGGVSLDLPQSFHVAPGNFFVLEGDEYDTAFWDKVPKFNHYLPDDVIITSVEYDHADIYPDLASVVRAFEGLIDRVRTGGRLVLCYDYEIIKELARTSLVPQVSYGSKPETGAKFTPGRVRTDGEFTRFEIVDNGKIIDELAIRLPGMHNVLNALSVWILCRAHGIPSREIAEGLATFRGVKRRQEVRGEKRGVTVIDDFAHHPTAVRETLRALRSRYAGQRLLAVYEPRSATSRRKIFQKEFGAAFLEADESFFAMPYDQSKIAADDQFSSEQLARDVVAGGRGALVFGTVEEGVAAVAKSARKGDVVAVLSNGGFGGFIPKLLEALG